MKRYLITYNARTKLVKVNQFFAYVNAENEKMARKVFNKNKPIAHSKIISISELM